METYKESQGKDRNYSEVHFEVDSLVHPGFGRGIHRCARTWLARMIRRIFLETMLDKCAD